MTSEIRIIEAESEEAFNDAAQLMREFLAWVRIRYRESPEMIDAYFDAAAWEDDLASLSENYAAPDGVVLLARHASGTAGCVSMRKLAQDTCEMKRLYVRDQYQKLGIGRILCERLLRCARERGYLKMRLETGDEQYESHALYRSLGFYEIEAYIQHPPVLHPRVVFMEATL